jgi:hypothetical protein
MTIEAIFNYCEAGLWFVLGVVVVIAARKQPSAVRRNAWVASAAFVVFGVSDLIEVRTGAWWTPWWLFVLKATCVLALAGCLWRHVRGMKPRP